MEASDFEFHFEADFVVGVGIDAVFFGLSILRHHDDGCLEGGEHGEGEVEEDEGVGIDWGLCDVLGVDNDPDGEDE